MFSNQLDIYDWLQIAFRKKMIAFLYHQQLSDGYPAGSPSFCLTVDHKMLIRRRKSEAFRNRLKPGWSSGAQAINKRWESLYEYNLVGYLYWMVVKQFPNGWFIMVFPTFW